MEALEVLSKIYGPSGIIDKILEADTETDIEIKNKVHLLKEVFKYYKFRYIICNYVSKA